MEQIPSQMKIQDLFLLSWSCSDTLGDLRLATCPLWAKGIMCKKRDTEREMIPGLKALATKTDKLSTIPRTHMIGEKQLRPLVLYPLHTCTQTLQSS